MRTATVGELREVIRDLPDDMPVIGVYDGGFGTTGDKGPDLAVEPHRHTGVMTLWIDAE